MTEKHRSHPKTKPNAKPRLSRLSYRPHQPHISRTSCPSRKSRIPQLFCSAWPHCPNWPAFAGPTYLSNPNCSPEPSSLPPLKPHKTSLPPSDPPANFEPPKDKRKHKCKKTHQPIHTLDLVHRLWCSLRSLKKGLVYEITTSPVVPDNVFPRSRYPRILLASPSIHGRNHLQLALTAISRARNRMRVWLNTLSHQP